MSFGWAWCCQWHRESRLQPTYYTFCRMILNSAPGETITFPLRNKDKTHDMNRFNNIPNEQITDTEGRQHWISPSVSVDALLVVNGFVLVVKRSDAMSNPGLWCLPCGFMDWGEDFLCCGMRELYEETGIDVREHNIYNMDYNRPHSLNGTALQFVFELVERPEVKLNKEECVEYKWVSISMLEDLEWAFGHDRLIEYLLSI